MIDEMGKYLDYASSVGSDLNPFQEIAEIFSNLRLDKKGNALFLEYSTNLLKNMPNR